MDHMDHMDHRDHLDSADATVLVVLAAGKGARFHGETHKLDAPLTIDGVSLTIAQHSITHALATNRPTIVVTGAVSPDMTPFDGHPNLIMVHNNRWAQGQATSIQAALESARHRHADAMVIGLADQPFIGADAWEAVAQSPAPIAIATYNGRRRNPVRLARSVWPALPTEGDFGARVLFEQWPETIDEVPCTGSPTDIDTLEDLQSWQSRSSTSSR